MVTPDPIRRYVDSYACDAEQVRSAVRAVLDLCDSGSMMIPVGVVRAALATALDVPQ